MVWYIFSGQICLESVCVLCSCFQRVSLDFSLGKNLVLQYLNFYIHKGCIVTRYCVYDEHPIAGQDIQCWAPDSRSGYTTPIWRYYYNVWGRGLVHTQRVKVSRKKLVKEGERLIITQSITPFLPQRNPDVYSNEYTKELKSYSKIELSIV